MPPALSVPSTGIRRVWILGFAGHRSLPDPAAVAQSIRHAVDHFRSQIDGELIGRSSAASGADLLFLEACRDLGLAYSVVLPFSEERFREDFEEDAEWTRAKSLIAAAASVEIAPGHTDAPEAYHLAAREIIDVSDAMIFVWDGQPGRGLGGTAESVEDARERKIPYQIIDSGSGSTGIFESARPFPWADAMFREFPAAGNPEELFHGLDRRAMRGAPQSRLLAAGSITLNQAATLVYGVLVAFSLGVEAAPVVKFLLVTVASILPWIGARTRIRERWMDDRLHAELLRSLLASYRFSSPLRPFAAELFLSEAPFLRSSAWKLAGLARPWAEEKSRYLDERLDGQIRYLDSKSRLAARRLSQFMTLFKVSSSGALILGAAAIIHGLSGGKPPFIIHSVFLNFLPTILPAVAAWCLAMVALFEYKRRAGLYSQIVKRLEIQRAELCGSRSFVTAAAAIASCERLLLTELWEWSDKRDQKN
ncbi:MAG: hypothetical protein ACRCXD_08585 [Luteolibacter sp.]